MPRSNCETTSATSLVVSAGTVTLNMSVSLGMSIRPLVLAPPKARLVAPASSSAWSSACEPSTVTTVQATRWNASLTGVVWGVRTVPSGAVAGETEVSVYLAVLALLSVLTVTQYSPSPVELTMAV